MLRRAHEPWFGHWDFPGGFCNAGEHPEETARREVEEETGLDVAIGELVGIWMDHYAPADASPLEIQRAETTTNLYYIARPLDDRALVLDPAEASEARWFSKDEVPEPIGFTNHFPAVFAAWRRR